MGLDIGRVHFWGVAMSGVHRDDCSIVDTTRRKFMMNESAVSLLVRPVTFALAVALLASCGGNDDPSDVTYQGTVQALGNGTARSFVTLDGGGAPRAVGVTLTADALSNLPTSGTLPMVLALPAQAASATVFNHVSLDWEAAGHDPAPIYGVPHFDVHVYLIGQAERQRIAFAPDEPAPAPEAIAEDYVSTRTVVPGMGQHWFDPKDPNNAPGKFSNVLIYGYNQGRMIFVEPMITRAALLSRQSLSAQIKQPRVYPKPGYYPTRYTVSFDEPSRIYTITLDQMVQR